MCVRYTLHKIHVMAEEIAAMPSVGLPAQASHDFR